MITNPVTFQYNAQGNAEIGGVSIAEITDTYGSPLYILDQATIEQNCNNYIKTCKDVYPSSKILYAGKANLTIGIAQLMNQLGMCLDVSSGGELYTAIKSGFPTEKIYFHGNNKTPEELSLALAHDVTIIVDNLQELIRITDLNTQKKEVAIQIRLKPEIEAHTHEYIRTGQLDSKFGVTQLECMDMVKLIQKHPQIKLKGIHSHIGSQIFDSTPYLELIDILVPFVYALKKEFGVVIEELNVGGGMGIYYTGEDDPIDIEAFIKKFCKELENKCRQFELDLPTLLMEPGRSIIGPAGITVYTIGAVKHIEGVKTYVFVDGGMADNPRPIMYDAVYTFDVATKRNKETQKYSIAGKYCESGDILAENIMLETCKAGDQLIVFGTGAYNYSMASHYNRNVKPGMVIVNKGQAKELVKRETYDDLIQFDCKF